MVFDAVLAALGDIAFAALFLLLTLGPLVLLEQWHAAKRQASHQRPAPVEPWYPKEEIRIYRVRRDREMDDGRAL